jgi:general stress protein 26
MTKTLQQIIHMSSTHNLSGKDAVEKLRQLTKDTPVCMFGSGLTNIPMHLCPMQVQEVDPQGCLWFFSGADSVHNANIEADPQTHLIFCNVDRIKYLTILGKATISRDREKIEHLWSKFVEAWFPDGPQDSNVTLLCVRPVLVHYWDTENGKLVTFAKILTAAVTGGATDDGGVQGKLDV